jgi:serine/threonine-protein phosphatase 6 regulatory ankyrin repeat subunit B
LVRRRYSLEFESCFDQRLAYAPLTTASAFEAHVPRYEHPSRQGLVDSQGFVRQSARFCADSAATSDAAQWKTCIAGFQKDDIVLDNFASLTSARTLIRRYDTDADKSLASALPSMELSKMLLSMVYLASNNLITDREASSAFQLLHRGNCLDLLTTLASSSLPAIKAVARKFLPGAVELGDIKMVKTFLSTGTNVDSPLNYGSDTLLLIAVRQGNLKMTECLLEHRADARRSPSILRAAVITGNLQLVKLLYDSGARDERRNTWTSGGTALQEAASKGQVEIVKYLLSRGVDVNADAGRNGKTVLEAAASTGIWDLVELILEHHPTDLYAAVVASINAGHDKVTMALIYQGIDLDGPNGETPLQAASRRGNAELVRTLVGMSADVNAAPEGYYGMTALQRAAYYGNLEVVRFLVEKGAKINAPPATLGGMTALQAAASGGNLQVVQFLLQHGADINSDIAEEEGQSILLAAVKTEDMELIQFLIDEGADVNAESAWCCGHTALEAAVDSGNIELVRLLLDHKADPNAHDAVPLITAAPTASYDMMKLLLDYGADVNKADAGGMTVIGHVVDERQYDFDIIELLLKHGASRTDALPAAARSGDIDLAEFLLDSEVDINATPRLGYSALAEAARAGDLDLVRLFLGYGANDRSGALYAAVEASHLALVRLLIRAGADVNAKYGFNSPALGRSVLKEAAIRGNLEITRLLLDSGTDVEVTEDTDDSTTKTTALQYAAIGGHLSVVHELVSRGADVNAPAWSDYHRTALEGAAEHGRLDTVQFLINMQANVHTSRALHFARKEGHDAVVALLIMQ